tara:strand:+ start:148 stop:663 length:516 start_codon:yes stop_codon:yes gene_type:complete
MIAKDLPSLETLDKLFSYNAESGALYRKMCSGKLKEAGTLNQGYIRVSVVRNVFAAHRLCWKICHKKDIPVGYEVDHINQDRSDNRISNLRLVTQSQNMRNKTRYRSNKSGLVGVAVRNDMREGTKRWRAQINVNGENIKLGSFKTKDEAIAARRDAEARFGFSENHGIGR